MLWLALFGALTALSLGIQCWQFLAASRFPLHRRRASSTAPAGSWPGITLLKPLKGCDDTTRASLASWLQQNYPGPLQVLFGVRDPQDPVVPLVRELIASHPKVCARLVVFPELLGANAKVSTLTQLEPLVEQDWLIISDADVRVPPDLLREMAVIAAEPGVGLVNCFYRLANPQNLAMRCEAVAINADFWSQVLQSRALQPQDFALGAVMMVSRAHLTAIGGFRSLVNHLADDFQLGRRVARNGGRIELCPVVVDCWDAPAGWSQVWAHQLRWARTIRVCQPGPYFASVLSNLGGWSTGLLLSLLGTNNAPDARWVLGGWTLVAVALVGRLGFAVALQCRFTGVMPPVWAWCLPWLKDVFGVALWLLAFVGNEVVWRGIRYRVTRDGCLIPAEAGPGSR